MIAVEKHTFRRNIWSWITLFYWIIVDFVRAVFVHSYYVEKSRCKTIQGQQLREVIESEYLRKRCTAFSPLYTKNSDQAKRVGFIRGACLVRWLQWRSRNVDFEYMLIEVGHVKWIESIHGKKANT
jgi:hypothetical protein